MIDSRLKSFAVLSDTLNFSKAGKILHLTQPAISKQMKTLQQEMECVLFTVSWHVVRLTKAGEILAEYAKRMIEMEERCKNEINALTTNKACCVIGYDKSLKYSKYIEIFAKLGRNHPECSFSLLEVDKGLFEDNLLDMRLDYVITLQKPSSSRLEAVRLAREPYVAVFSPNHALASSDITLSGLRRYPLCALKHQRKIKGIYPNFLVEDLSMLSALLRQEYVSLILESTIIDDSFLKKPVQGCHASEDIYLVRLRRHESPYEQEIISICEKMGQTS